jgi:hypothetical protein
MGIGTPKNIINQSRVCKPSRLKQGYGRRMPRLWLYRDIHTKSHSLLGKKDLKGYAPL